MADAQPGHPVTLDFIKTTEALEPKQCLQKPVEVESGRMCREDPLLPRFLGAGCADEGAVLSFCDSAASAALPAPSVAAEAAQGLGQPGE